MANVTTIGTIKDLMSYLPDGPKQVLEGFLRFLPPEVQLADNLTMYTAVAVHTIVEISDIAGSIPYVVIAKSAGEAAFVKLYPDDSGDVTVGTTSAMATVAVSAVLGELSCALLVGKGFNTLVNAANMDGLSIAAPATDVGTGAVTLDPTVWVLYKP